jgi:hypothetical protein
MLKINHTDSEEEYAFVLEKGAVANTEVTVGLIRVYLCVYLTHFDQIYLAGTSP